MAFQIRRSSVLLFVAVAALSLLSFLSVSAGTDGGASFSLDCNGFVGTGGQILLDRNNTGNNREAFIVSATDGAGNVIYAPVEDSFFVGGTVMWSGSDRVDWSATPQYNPLTLRVMSRAGNGFAEELISLATGSCDGLPTYGATPEVVWVVDGDFLKLAGQGGGGTLVLPAGFTSPTVELNEVPPRPEVSLDEVVDELPGYMIVNTDNLSLRSGPGPAYTLVGILDGGTRLAVLGRNLDYSWWYVQAGDLVGWSKGEFLIVRGDLTGVPVVPSQGEISEPRFVLYADGNLLASPSDTALPLCAIPGNLEYRVVGRDAKGEWYQVQATCDNAVVKGWLPVSLGALRNLSNSFIDVTWP